MSTTTIIRRSQAPTQKITKHPLMRDSEDLTQEIHTDPFIDAMEQAHEYHLRLAKCYAELASLALCALPMIRHYAYRKRLNQALDTARHLGFID